MKNSLFLFAVAFILASCSNTRETASYAPDDIYWSSSDREFVDYSDFEEVEENDDYYSEEEAAELKEEKTVINNYYDYNDFDRWDNPYLRYSAFYGYSYYDPFIGFYYSNPRPFGFYNPWRPGWSVSFNSWYGWNIGFNYGWGYNPYYYNPWGYGPYWNAYAWNNYYGWGNPYGWNNWGCPSYGGFYGGGYYDGGFASGGYYGTRTPISSGSAISSTSSNYIVKDNYSSVNEGSITESANQPVTRPVERPVENNSVSSAASIPEKPGNTDNLSVKPGSADQPNDAISNKELNVQPVKPPVVGNKTDNYSTPTTKETYHENSESTPVSTFNPKPGVQSDPYVRPSSGSKDDRSSNKSNSNRWSNNSKTHSNDRNSYNKSSNSNRIDRSSNSRSNSNYSRSSGRSNNKTSSRSGNSRGSRK